MIIELGDGGGLLLIGDGGGLPPVPAFCTNDGFLPTEGLPATGGFAATGGFLPGVGLRGAREGCLAGVTTACLTGTKGCWEGVATPFLTGVTVASFTGVTIAWPTAVTTGFVTVIGVSGVGVEVSEVRIADDAFEVAMTEASDEMVILRGDCIESTSAFPCFGESLQVHIYSYNIKMVRLFDAF